MSRFTRFRDSVRMSHDWPRRTFQAARHGDSLASLLQNVPGHRGFTSQLDSLIGNEKWNAFFSWAVPRIIGGGFGAAVGMPSLGFGLGGMLDKSEQPSSDDSSGPIPTPAVPGEKSFSFQPAMGGGSSLADLLAMTRQGGQGGMGGQSGGLDRPYIGGGGLI